MSILSNQIRHAMYDGHFIKFMFVLIDKRISPELMYYWHDMVLLIMAANCLLQYLNMHKHQWQLQQYATDFRSHSENRLLTICFLCV